jgi:hypothetical protein
MIATDGSAIAEILDLLGAPLERQTARVDRLEAALGRRLPDETRALLSRPPRLVDPDANDHPEIDALDFFGGLPDVDAWLARLARGLEGPFLAACQFFALVPFAVRIDACDSVYAMAAIDGGVYTYDEREVSPAAPTVSRFLADELIRFRDRDGDYDCYRLDVDPGELPDFAEVPPAIDAAYKARAADALDARSLWWIPAALRGETAAWALDAIPGPELWGERRALVAERHGDAMFWLLAHALLGNRAELADARELAEKNPSRLVAALRAYLGDRPDFIDRHREWRLGLYELARRHG